MENYFEKERGLKCQEKYEAKLEFPEEQGEEEVNQKFPFGDYKDIFTTTTLYLPMLHLGVIKTCYVRAMKTVKKKRNNLKLP